MANDIFDWDDDVDEKRSEAEIWGAYPLAQPPETGVAAPPSQPSPPPTESGPPVSDEPEMETVIRPRQELFEQYSPAQQQPQQPQENSWVDYPPDAFDQPVHQQPGVWSEYKPESPDDTARQGGLAWSAGIVFFSSVGFMLFLGWIADWLLGTSPWGVIIGIVLGSILGFVQFFRISSRIFGAKKNEVAERPLMPPDDPRERV